MAKKFHTTTLVALAAVLGIGLRAAFIYTSVTRIPPVVDESIIGLQSKGILEDKDSVLSRARQEPRWIAGSFPLLFTAQPYAFPLDAYLNLPFVTWMPRNALGIRIHQFLMGILCVGAYLLILKTMGALKQVWPGYLLVLFPSAYLLMFQAGYAPPCYLAFLLLSAFVMILLKHYDRTARLTVLTAAAIGLLCGLGSATQLLFLPLLLLAGVALLLNRGIKKAPANMPAFLLGVLAGSAPYWLARFKYPGAYAAVSGMRPWREALSGLWSPMLTFTLPTTMGASATLFPDSDHLLSPVPAIGELFGIIWVVLTVSASALCAFTFVKRTLRTRTIELATADIFVLLSWLCLGMAVASRRTHSLTFRYVLPVIWTFPFVLAYTYSRSARAIRAVLGTLAVLLSLWNLAMGAGVIRRWQSDGFAAEVPRLYDLEPAIAYLKRQGIDRCYANYFDTYRINYMTDERIVCSQHYNRRFPYWPLPYKDLVDSSTNVAYILGPSWHFIPEAFHSDLKSMAVGCTHTQFGPVHVYSDFSRSAAPGQRIEPSLLTARTSHNGREAHLLADGDPLTRWCSNAMQEKGAWVEIQLPETTSLCRLQLDYSHCVHDCADTLRVLAGQGDTLRVVLARIPLSFDAFDYVNGHPSYGPLLQTIDLPSIETDRVRVEIVDPRKGREWIIGDLRVMESRGDTGGHGPEA